MWGAIVKSGGRDHPSPCRARTAEPSPALRDSVLATVTGVERGRVLRKRDPRPGGVEVCVGQVKVERKVVESP